MFFHALTFVGSRGSFWTRDRQAECSNIFRGIRKVLMQWNKHVWSLFFPFLDSNLKNRTEKARKKHQNNRISFVRSLSQNGVSLQNRTSKTPFPLTTLTSTEAYKNAHSRPQRFMQTNLGMSWGFSSKNMFKQHVNFMIQTWIWLVEHGFHSFNNGFKRLCT